MIRTRPAFAVFVLVALFTGLLAPGYHPAVAQDDDDNPPVKWDDVEIAWPTLMLAKREGFQVVFHGTTASATASVDLTGLSGVDVLHAIVRAAGLATTAFKVPGGETVVHMVHATDAKIPALSNLDEDGDDNREPIQLRCHDFPLTTLLVGVADQYKLAVVCSPRLSGSTTLYVDDVPAVFAVELALASCGQQATPFECADHTILMCHPVDQELASPYGTEWPATLGKDGGEFWLRAEDFPANTAMLGIAEQYELNMVIGKCSPCEWTMQIVGPSVRDALAATFMATGKVGDWVVGPLGGILIVRDTDAPPTPAWSESALARTFSHPTRREDGEDEEDGDDADDDGEQGEPFNLRAEDFPLGAALLAIADQYELDVALEVAGIEGVEATMWIDDRTVIFAIWAACAANGLDVDVVRDGRGTLALYVRDRDSLPLRPERFDIKADKDTPLVENLQLEDGPLVTATESLVGRRPIVVQKALGESTVSVRFHQIDRITALHLVAASAGGRLHLVPDAAGGAGTLFIRRTDD